MIYHLLTEAEIFSEHHGGAISRWAFNVLRNDNEASVVCARVDETWEFPAAKVLRIQALGWYWHALRLSRNRCPWRLRVLALRLVLARFSGRLRAGDVVYIHNRPEFAFVFRALLKRKSVKLVLHLHNSHLITYPRAITAHATADLTLFCSRFLEDEARLLLPNLAPTAVIANGADGTLFHPRNAENEAAAKTDIPLVLFVGRLVPEKGAHVFIEALRILDQRGIRVIGRVVGSAEFGSDAATVYTRQLTADAPQSVQFRPYASGTALAVQFREAAIFCCPSVWNEAFGMVNVEAMASGLPVVATSVGGIPEIFSGGGAILVPPDSAQDLADAIAALAADPALRERLASEGYAAFLMRFDWDVIRKRYRELMEMLRGENAFG